MISAIINLIKGSWKPLVKGLMFVIAILGAAVFGIAGYAAAGWIALPVAVRLCLAIGAVIMAISLVILVVLSSLGI